MSEKEQNGQLLELAGQLEEKVLMAGQTAFDAINEHDKLLQIVRDTITQMQETFGNMDMIHMEITGIIEDMQVLREQKDRLYGLHDRIAAEFETAFRKLQEIIAEAEIGSETIHRMEEDVALTQEISEAVCTAIRTEQ